MNHAHRQNIIQLAVHHEVQCFFRYHIEHTVRELIYDFFCARIFKNFPNCAFTVQGIGVLTLYHQRGLCQNVLRRQCQIQRVRPDRLHPLIHSCVIAAQCLFADRYIHNCFLTGGKAHLGIPHQCAVGAQHMGLFLAGIKLYDLAAGAAADVFYPHRHIQCFLCAHIPAEVIFTQFHRKIRVAQAASERILHS